MDKSRLRGVRYGSSSGSGMMYSNSVMDAMSLQVLSVAIANAGDYSSAAMETYYEEKPLNKKSDFVEAYQEMFGAGKVGRKLPWQDALAKDLSSITGESIASIKRSLRPSRINQPGNRQGYDKLAQRLPPKLVERQRARKPQRARVNFSIHFKISQNSRSVKETEYLSDSETKRLMEDGDFDAVLEAYELNNIDLLEEMEISSLFITLE